MDEQEKAIEIFGNEDLVDLLIKHFKNLKKIKKDKINDFIEKYEKELKEISSRRCWRIWLYDKKKKYKDEMNKLKEEKRVVDKMDISYKTIQILKYNIKKKLFLRIKDCILKNINEEIIKSLKILKGDTQRKERLSIDFIKKCLDLLDYSYEEAGSQQSKDFRNINNIGLNIEVKKTDSTTVYFNDTLPSLDIFYIIIFTGKEYKTKKNISPKLIFINGYELCKPDLYLLLDYKKDIEDMKNKWGRKKGDEYANKFKHFSVYPRPTYKTDISYLINSDYSYNLNQ